MDLGFVQAGFRVVWANDTDGEARRIHGLNLPGGIYAGDIREADPGDIPDADVLTGGFPCQPFSSSGKRLGVEDPRGLLYLEAMRVIRAKRPGCVLLENVPGIIAARMPDGRSVADAIAEDLRREGYDAEYAVLNAADYGVPQLRKRVFFLGVRGAFPSFPPKVRGCPGAAQTLGAILPVPPDVPDQDVIRLERATALIVPHIPAGGSWKDVPDRYLPQRFLRMRGDMRLYHSPKFFRRVARTEICRTVTANGRPDKGCNIHPTEDRCFSVREYARIQSFPDSFRFPALPGRIPSMYRVIGNAVPPLLARRLAEHILKTHVRPEPGVGLRRNRLF
jgi:DNA (cytosine-5)-methyltransferase 1